MRGRNGERRAHASDGGDAPAIRRKWYRRRRRAGTTPARGCAIHTGTSVL